MMQDIEDDHVHMLRVNDSMACAFMTQIHTFYFIISRRPQLCRVIVCGVGGLTTVECGRLSTSTPVTQSMVRSRVGSASPEAEMRPMIEAKEPQGPDARVTDRTRERPAERPVASSRFYRFQSRFTRPRSTRQDAQR